MFALSSSIVALAHCRTRYYAEFVEGSAKKKLKKDTRILEGEYTPNGRPVHHDFGGRVACGWLYWAELVASVVGAWMLRRPA